MDPQKSTANPAPAAVMPQQPVVNTPTAQSTQPPANPSEAASQDNKKSKAITIISIFLFLLSALYLYGTISSLIVVQTINGVLFNVGVVLDNILKLVPEFGSLPIIFSLAATYHLYLAFKVKDGSKKSFWLVLVSLLVVTLIVIFASNLLVMALSSSLENAFPTPEGIDASIILAVLNPGLLLQLLTFLILIFSYKKFQFESAGISKFGKILIVITFVVVVLPTTAFVVYGLTKPADTDYGYTQLAGIVNYKVYRPSYLPSNLAQATKYRISDHNLEGYPSTVTTSFGPPFDQSFEEETPTVIVMNQVGIDKNFDIDNFIQKKVDDGYNLTEASVQVASGNKAYFREKTTGDLNLVYLDFVTDDNVLVEFGTPNASKETLLMIANTLN
jgi:hypothetical protein